jgi:uncharacterized protein DUF4136
MWFKPIVGVVVAATIGVLACGPAIDVRTIASPDARFSSLRTFRVLPAPRAPRGEPLDARHPMLVNSIANRVLRQAIVLGFESQGYVVDETNPDFTVAVYASAREKLEVTYWDYGYPWRPRWWGGWGRGRFGPTVTEYTEGTVIIDAIDPATQDLLWRGRGVAMVSDDEQEYLTHLRNTVAAILEKFPHAPPMVAAMP